MNAVSKMIRLAGPRVRLAGPTDRRVLSTPAVAVARWIENWRACGRRVSPLLVVFLLSVSGSWLSGSAAAYGQSILQRLESRIRSELQDIVPNETPPAGPGLPAEQRLNADPNAAQGGIGADGQAAPRLRDRIGPAAQKWFGRDRPATPAAPADRADTSSDQPGPTGSLGVSANDGSGAVSGAEILQLYEHSQAEKYGFRRGDLIVTINGVPTPSVRALTNELQRYRVGDTVDLQILRGGRLTAGPIELVGPPGTDLDASERQAEPPTTLPPPATLLPPAADTSGATLLPPPPQGRANRDAGDLPLDTRGVAEDTAGSEPGNPPSARLGIETENAEGEQGAVVTEVMPRSPAASAGLKSGDRIVSVDGRVVVGAWQLQQEFTRYLPGDQPTIQIVRGSALIELKPTLAGPDGIAKPAGKTTANNASGGGGSSDQAGASSGGGSILRGFGSALGELFKDQGDSGTATKANPAESAPEQQPLPPPASDGLDKQPDDEIEAES